MIESAERYLLISSSLQPESMRISGLAASRGWQIAFLPLEAPLPIESDSTVVIYGQPTIAIKASTEFGIALLEPPLDLITKIPTEFLLREIYATELRDARLNQKTRFMKPADCANKCFAAAVYENGRQIQVDPGTPEDTRVLVSDVIRWAAEYRLVISDRRIVAWSPYVVDGWRVAPTAGQWPFPHEHATPLLEFCRDFLERCPVEFPPSFVLDVGITRDEQWAVIEFNPIWCAGLYGCQLTKILDALRVSCVSQTRVTREVSRWMVDRGL